MKPTYTERDVNVSGFDPTLQVIFTFLPVWGVWARIPHNRRSQIEYFLEHCSERALYHSFYSTPRAYRKIKGPYIYVVTPGQKRPQKGPPKKHKASKRCTFFQNMFLGPPELSKRYF